jgi:protein-disulfide isomerase
VAKNAGKTAQLITSGAKRDRNRTFGIQAAVAIVLIVLIAAIGLSVAKHKSHKDQVNAAQQAVAAGPADLVDGAVRFGNPNGKNVITVYEDFQCPACQMFELQEGGADYMEQLIAKGQVTVDYRPGGYLDSFGAGQADGYYGTRAANASACIAEADKDKWLAWHKLMYTKQPPENTGGLPDSALVDIAKQAGIESPQVAACIIGEKYKAFVAAQTSKANIDHTPTVDLNGKEIKQASSDQSVVTALKQALAAQGVK